MKVILILLCAVLVSLFLSKESQEQYVPAVILKGLASLCFVVLGIMCNLGNQTTSPCTMRDSFSSH